MLKILFNNEIKKLTVPIREVELFTCLAKALQSYPNVKTHICHQKYVRHYKKCYMRELCDLFVLIIHEDYFRYSFVQNKYVRRKKYRGLSDFKIDCGQHRILVEKPKIQIVGTSCYSDILSLGRYDTITAYSIFYKDINGDYDFDFASANSVQCCNNKFLACTTGKSNATHINSSKNFNLKNSKIDYDSLLNISEIENNPEFGEVVYFDKKCAKFDESNLALKELSEFVSQFNLGEAVKALLKKCNLEINDNQKINYEEEFLNNKTNLNFLTQPFYVRKMLVIDLNNKEITNECARTDNY